MHGVVESRFAAILARADASAAHAVKVLSEHVQKSVAEIEAKTSRTVGTVVQQLEQEIATAATAKITTRTAVEGMRRDVQAQIDQNRADTLHKIEEAQRKVEQVSNELQELTTQLNQFKPASAQTVNVAQNKLSEEFQQQLALQSKVSEDVQQKLVAQTVRIDQLSESVRESQKTAQANADLVQTLLVGMENLGEHFKQLQADLKHWKSPAYQEAEREYEEMNQALLQEVSLSVPAVTRPESAAIPSTIPIPPVFTAPSVTMPQSVSLTATTEELKSMGLHTEWVTGTALSKPYSGVPTPPAALGFNLGQTGQDAQEKRQAPGVQTTTPKFFQMGSVTKVPNIGSEVNHEGLRPFPFRLDSFRLMK